MWNELRGSRFKGHKFRRQKVIGSRIVDFFCPAKGLVIEIDGDTHDPISDSFRDRTLLCHLGFATIRFSNHEIITNLDGVLERLAQVLESAAHRWEASNRNHPPTPSFEKEGE